MRGMRRAVTQAPGTMRIEACERPVLTDGQARIGVQVVGLCGSDYHLFDGTHPYSHFPQTQGHEFAGVVLELAEGYGGAIRVGDGVAVEPTAPCGDCIACRRGRPNCCVSLKVLGAHLPGALASEITVSTQRLYSLGDLDFELGALVEPVSIGLHAVVRGQITAEDTVAVLGAGPIGLAATLAANDLGARILVADLIESRLQRALSLGAEAVVDTSQVDLADAVEKFTTGDGATVVIDATGVPALIRGAFGLVAHSGTIVVVGISTEDVNIPVIEFSRKEVTVHGSRNSCGEFTRAVDLIRRYPEQVRAWITHRISLAELPDAIQFAAGNPDRVEKMVVLMDEGA